MFVQLRRRLATTTSASTTSPSSSHIASSGIDALVPVVRARLEEHHYNTLADDLLVLAYSHESPLAPSAADARLKLQRDAELATTEKRLSLTKLFQTPLEKLPTRPLDSLFPTTNLLSLKAVRYSMYHANTAGGRIRRRLSNILDYTTITDAQFSKLDRLKTKEVRELHRGFEKNFSPRVDHLPAIRKVVLKIWDEKAINNKQILLPALLSLEAITGATAQVLYATSKDTTKTIRVGMPLGAQVTLSPPLAHEFLDKCTQTLLPRLREWPGISPLCSKKGKSVGIIGFRIPVGSVGAFPDIEPHFDIYPQLFEINVEIHTTAGTDKGAVALLSGFQMPFRSREEVLDEIKAGEAARNANKVEDPFAKFRKKEEKGGKKK
ncbi:UNVERIFIED_CONTAM: hypothetical protein HDU68_008839 [Siphonaria sp. JEL0065]|nr:hypothetical protein HDU68_008839 [Siphonaria sp. JEL0065]